VKVEWGIHCKAPGSVHYTGDLSPSESSPLANFNPFDIAIQYFCLLFALCVHEASHAIMADRRGDSTARFLGRITLDPRSHIDPIGTVVLPLMMMIFNIPLFGWAKPVPFNPANLKDRRLDPVWIAIAGPASNLIMGTAALFVLRMVALLFDGGMMSPALFEVLRDVTAVFALINFILVFFNLIPFPPLDGHYVLKHFLPPRAEAAFEQIGPFGILIALLIAQIWIPTALEPIYWLIGFALTV